MSDKAAGQGADAHMSHEAVVDDRRAARRVLSKNRPGTGQEPGAAPEAASGQAVYSAGAAQRRGVEQLPLARKAISAVHATRQPLRSSSKTRKSRATREKIMSAATEIMIEQGGIDFQMSEVSARCHMSKGALYYYFSDKDELIQAVFTAAEDELVQAAEQVVEQSDSAREALEGLCTEFARRIRTKRLLIFVAAQEISKSGAGVVELVSGPLARIVRIISAQLELGKAEGFVDADADTTLAASYITGGVVGATIVSAYHDGLPSDGLACSLVSLVMQGISPHENPSLQRNAPSGASV